MKTASQPNRVKLVKGIHPRATKLLTGKPVWRSVLRVLRGVQPARQMEMAGLMVNLSNYTKVFAQALLLGTSAKQLVKGNTAKQKSGIPDQTIARMESEMESLEREFAEIKGRYCQNMQELVMIQGYVRRVLQNTNVIQFLKLRYADLYLEIEAIAALRGL